VKRLNGKVSRQSLNWVITEKVKRPRALVVTFPVGYHMGNPSGKESQRQILTEALKRLIKITKAETIADLPEIYYITGGENRESGKASLEERGDRRPGVKKGDLVTQLAETSQNSM
jgi:hypothetical protein